jgi:hypothetical protein
VKNAWKKQQKMCEENNKNVWKKQQKMCERMHEKGLNFMG